MQDKVNSLNQNLKTIQETPEQKARAEQIKEIRKQLQSRQLAIDSRLSGASRNLSQTLKAQTEYTNSLNVFRAWGGEGDILKKQVENEEKYLKKLRAEKETFNQTNGKIEKLLSEGKIDEARAVLQGKEAEYKQRMQSISKEVMSDLQKSNEALQDTDKFLGKVETTGVIIRNTAVITAATIATGGAAGAMVAAGYGTAAVAAGAIATGTAVGTTVGGLSNVAKASVEVGVYDKSAKEAFTEAGMQTLQDAKNSAIAAAGTVSGMGVASKIAGQAASTGMKIVASGAAGATNSSISTVINTTESRILAEREFYATYKDQIKNAKPEEIDKLKTEFLTQRKLTAGQIVKNAAIDVSVGLISGGQGGAFDAAKDATKKALTKTVLKTTEIAGSAAIGLGATYAKEGELTYEAFVEEASSAFIGDVVGGMTHKNLKGNGENNNSHTTQDANQRIESYQNTYRSIESNENRDHTNTPEKIDLPKDVTESPIYKAATKNSIVEIECDPLLPAEINSHTVSTQDLETGKKETKIKFNEETSKKIEEDSIHGREIIAEELTHANQSFIDPGVNGSNMSETEYTTRRAFQEITAESASSSKFGGERRGEVLTQLKELIDSGKHEEAIKLAKENGLNDSDIANYKLDYKENISSDRTKLIQRNNSSATLILSPKIDDYEAFFDTGNIEELNSSIEMIRDELKKNPAKINEILSKFGPEGIMKVLEATDISSLENPIQTLREIRQFADKHNIKLTGETREDIDAITLQNLQRLLVESPDPKIKSEVIKFIDEMNLFPNLKEKGIDIKKVLDGTNSANRPYVVADRILALLFLEDTENISRDSINKLIKRIDDPETISLLADISRLKQENAPKSEIQKVLNFMLASDTAQSLAQSISSNSNNDSSGFKGSIAVIADKVLSDRRNTAEAKKFIEDLQHTSDKKVKGNERILENAAENIGTDEQIHGFFVEASNNRTLSNITGLILDEVSVRGIDGKSQLFDTNGKSIPIDIESLEKNGYSVVNGHLYFNEKPVLHAATDKKIQVDLKNGKLLDSSGNPIMLTQNNINGNIVTLPREIDAMVEGKLGGKLGKFYIEHKTNGSTVLNKFNEDDGRQLFALMDISKSHGANPAIMLGEAVSNMTSKDILSLDNILNEVGTNKKAEDGYPELMILDKNGNNITTEIKIRAARIRNQQTHP